MGVFYKLFKRKKVAQKDVIVVVSGLPRSGTSMMMKMLEAGGLELLTDNIRTPDKDNPKGYYELERVKKLEKDNLWLSDAKGRAVKIISMLLHHLPHQYSYKVIFMNRIMEEILASQKKMLTRRGEATDKVTDGELSEKFYLHLQNVKEWLEKQPNFDVLYISYNKVLENAHEQVKGINEFLGNILDAEEMTSMVDSTLYRQRR